MSIRLMNDVWKAPVSATDKLVLLALADWSNDDGQCWPSMAQLIVKTGLSERGVRKSLRRLEDEGQLTSRQNPGKGVHYTVHPGTTCPPAQNAPRHHVPQTPARRAPNTSGTTNKPSQASPSRVTPASGKARRGTRLPEQWSLPDEWRAWAIAQRTDWPPGRVDSEAERFADHFRAAAGSRGVKQDWAATWRNWVRNSERFDNDRQRSSPSHGRQGGQRGGGFARLAGMGFDDHGTRGPERLV